MHMITISFGSSSCPLLFKTAEAAQETWEKLMPPFQGGTGVSMEQMRAGAQQPASIPTRHIFLKDDFGREIYITGSNFNGAIMEDMAVAQEGQIEIGLHQARTQAKANQRGQQDPTLRAAQQQGPAMIHPGLNGGGRMF